MRPLLLLLALLVTACGDPGGPEADGAAADTVRLRVATYNIEDVRTEDLRDASHVRLRAAAAVVQRLRPDVLLINEIAYDAAGDEPGAAAGTNARRFVEHFLAVSQGEGLEPIRYRTYMAPSNTGEASGFDFDNSGAAVTAYPPVPGATPDGRPGPQTDGGRAYGNDAYGFGTFPGQYAMALLVREPYEIVEDEIKTFRLLPWSRLPGAELPADPDTGAPWLDDAEAEAFRLSSKSHWDVPVRLPDGRVLHVLASHPTPPAFDGPERRNKLRNRDEIRFWGDYLSGADYIRSDSGAVGGLPDGVPFVLLGDLNADPDEGSAINDPVGTYVLSNPRVNGDYVPRADSAGRAAFPDLDPDDTAQWGQRADYVIPSADLRVLDGGVYRPTDAGGAGLSDHFPVWLDLAVPPADGD